MAPLRFVTLLAVDGAHSGRSNATMTAAAGRRLFATNGSHRQTSPTQQPLSSFSSSLLTPKRTSVQTSSPLSCHLTPRVSLAQAQRRLFHPSAHVKRAPIRDPEQAEREAGTVAGHRAARARAEALAKASSRDDQDGGAGSAQDGGRSDEHGSNSSNGKGFSFSARLQDAWRRTPVKWYPIPILLGALVLVGVQARRNYLSDRAAEQGPGRIVDENGQVVTMSGPWTVYVLAALPLNGISRLWGWANGLTLPVWFRPFGFRLYARIFGCNLDEMADKDLTHYRSLGEFFYRELQPGARMVDEDAPIVSPADGTVLHFGTIQGRRVEQVKGITYSLDALLGLSSSPQGIEQADSGPGSPLDERQFAAINGIDYSLDRLLGDESSKKKYGRYKRFVTWKWWKSFVVRSKSAPTSPQNQTGVPPSARSTEEKNVPSRTSQPYGPSVAQSEKASVGSDNGDDDDDDDDDEASVEEAGVETPDSPEILSRYASVAYEMGSGALPPILQRHSPGQEGVAEGNKLHFAVIYLAPGDYHRFHSPTNWVVERRRHFRGELYSVSPYIAQRLSNLFILNERVALLGRWRYGFFSMIPVGATNVGSIRINFDQHLRTNVKEQRPLAGTYSEATYGKASRMLGGQPLSKGEEMGGFLLGSTIVLVWESPDFAFEIEPGQKIQVGQKLGDLGAVDPSTQRRQAEQNRKRKRWWFF
ncbi:unnamed protein product [Parajaminaea phylloscopi]